MLSEPTWVRISWRCSREIPDFRRNHQAFHLLGQLHLVCHTKLPFSSGVVRSIVLKGFARGAVQPDKEVLEVLRQLGQGIKLETSVEPLKDSGVALVPLEHLHADVVDEVPGLARQERDDVEDRLLAPVGNLHLLLVYLTSLSKFLVAALLVVERRDKLVGFPGQLVSLARISRRTRSSIATPLAASTHGSGLGNGAPGQSSRSSATNFKSW